MNIVITDIFNAKPDELKQVIAILTELLGKASNDPFDRSIPAEFSPPGLPAVPVAHVPHAVPPIPSSVVPIVPPIAQPGPGIDVDSLGLPWDARIHSSNHAKNEDGRWRSKRGVDPRTASVVEAELRQIMQAQPVSSPVSSSSLFGQVPPPPFVPDVAPIVPPPSGPGLPGDAGGVMTLPSNVVPVPAPPPVADPISLFPKLSVGITQGLQTGTLNMSRVTEACQAAGIAGIQNLVQRPDLIPVVAMYLGIAL